MAVFAPVDQSGPDARRKQLIAKLMGQAQSNTAQGRAAVGLIGAAGPTFHGGQLALARPAATQDSNVINSALANLGGAGMPTLPSQAVPFQLPVDPHASAHAVSGGVGMPTGSPTGPAAAVTTAAADPGTSIVPSSPVTQLLAVDPNSPGYVPPGYVPLGGGHFYDPSTNAVVAPGTLRAAGF